MSILTRKLAIILIGTVCVFCIFLIAFGLRIRREAYACLRTVRVLEIGKTSESESLSRLARFKAFETIGETNIQGSLCQTHVYRFYNRPYSWMALLRRSRFETGVTFCDGVLVARGAGLTQGTSLVVGSQESTQGLLGNQALDDSPRGMIIGVFDPPTRMNVQLDTRATEKDRLNAFKYDLSCFVSVIYCSDVRAVLADAKD